MKPSNLPFLFLLVLVHCQPTNEKQKMTHPIAIAVHGGCGDIKKMNLTPQEEQAYLDVLSAALDKGYAWLQQGNSGLDAVQAVVELLEDHSLFNAGKGSVLTHDGDIEMDASIMDGQNLKCGAVTCVSTIKNPIAAARKVMEGGEFVFLSSRGAEQFAAENGLEFVKPEYFHTEKREEQLKKVKGTGKSQLDHDSTANQVDVDLEHENKSGTVGCVALDLHGNLAAATSTGGTVNKRYNRIGDSPVIGAGTYASNKSCAVSCTGRGEDFIRLAVAHAVSSMMEFSSMTLKQATEKAMQQLEGIDGRGGLIAVDKNGNIAMPFNTSGMFRGMIDKNGNKSVAIY